MAITGPLIGTVQINTTAVTTINVPYPASLTSAHYMVLVVTVNSAVGAAASLPSGWTSVFQNSNTAGTNSPSMLVAIKKATGSESGSLAVTTASAKAWGQIIAFLGVDPTTPQDVTATTVDTTTSTATTVLPAMSTTRGGCALVYAGAHNSGNDTATPPSFLIAGAATETGDNTGTGGWAGTMGYLIWGGSGNTGAGTINWNGSAKGLGVLLALRPLAVSTSSNNGFFIAA